MDGALRTRLGGVAGAVAVAAALVLGPGSAAAASPLRGPGTPLPGTWLGSYATFGGEPWVWCVDAGRALPGPGHPWTPTPVPAPQVAYALSVHGERAEPEQHAALSFLVHTSPELPHDAVAALPPRPPEVQGMDLPGRVAALADEAARLAGPYSVGVDMQADADGRTARVTASLTSAAGHPLPGRAMVARLSGPARWDDGSTRLEVTSGAGPAEWEVAATGDGEVTVTVEAAVPPLDVRLFDPGRAGVQRVVAAAPPETVTGSARADLRATFVPHVTTRTSEAVAPGAVLTDLLDVATLDGTTWPAGVTVEVVSTLWGPFDERPPEGGEADSAPEGAPVAGQVTTSVEGPGTVETAGAEPSAAGYYVWTEQVAPDAHQIGWSGRFGLAAETTLVRWQPEVRTRTSDAVTFAGAELRDHLAVTGVRPGGSVVVESTLWGPFAERPPEAPAPPDGAPRVGTVRTAVDADGEWTTDALVVPSPGWYVWTETIAGDAHHAPWSSTFGRVSETTHVPEPVPEAAVPQVEVRASRHVPELARTGIEPLATVTAGAGLLGVGGGLVAGSRRRRADPRHRAGPDASPPAAARAGWVPERPTAVAQPDVEVRVSRRSERPWASAVSR